MQKGNEAARVTHKALGATNMVLFLWQVQYLSSIADGLMSE